MYHCTDITCIDYDLCEDCKAKADHDPSHRWIQSQSAEDDEAISESNVGTIRPDFDVFTDGELRRSNGSLGTTWYLGSESTRRGGQRQSLRVSSGEHYHFPVKDADSNSILMLEGPAPSCGRTCSDDDHFE